MGSYTGARRLLDVCGGEPRAQAGLWLWVAWWVGYRMPAFGEREGVIRAWNLETFLARAEVSG